MKKKYKDFIRKAEESPDYWADLFTLELTEDLWKIMKERKIGQKKLSNLLGTSEGYISRVLNGDENLSIKSISKLSLALGCAPHIHIAAKNIIVEWKERTSSETRIEIVFESYPEKGENFVTTYGIEPQGPYNIEKPFAKFPGDASPDWRVRTHEDTLVEVN